MAFTFKTNAELEEAKKKREQDEANLRNHETYTPTTYTQSQELQDMWGKITNWEKPTWNKDGNTWWQKLTDTMDAIENREKFSYDLNGDMLYQQYKDQYTNLGNLAMMDTMGQAAAMTGGYGNSYAQSVGQQAYQGYLQQLNDKIPELYQLAYDRYSREGDEMYNKLSAYGNLYNTEYGEYRDSVSDSYADLSNLTNLYGIKSDEEYNQWYNGEQLNMAANEQAYQKLSDLLGISTEAAKNLYEDMYKSQYDTYLTDYTEKRDAVADDQWLKNFNEGARQFNATFAETQKQNEFNNRLAQQQLDETIRANRASEAAALARANNASSSDKPDKFTQEEWDNFNAKCAEYKENGDNEGLANYIMYYKGTKLSEDEADDLYDTYYSEPESSKPKSPLTTPFLSPGGMIVNPKFVF